MDPADLIRAVLRGTLSGRRRKRGRKALGYLTAGRGSFINASTILTAAGLAWGAYETWKQRAGSTGSIGDPTAPAPVVPPPIPGAAPVPPIPGAGVPEVSSDSGGSLSPALLRVVRLAVSAARADGPLGDPERHAILEHARQVGAEAVVAQEIDRNLPLAQIVDGVSDPKERADLYTLAFAIVRADETLNGAERIYLAQLAAQLGLDPAAAAELEQRASTQIDSRS